MRLLFPNNVYLRNGNNPAVFSQLKMGENIQNMGYLLTPYTGFQIPGNLEMKGTLGNVEYAYRTNNGGFLTPYPVSAASGSYLKKGANDRLVLLTGGSAAWGYGATRNETSLGYVLERFLNARYSQYHWIVLNLSMGSWIAYQEFIGLDLYGAHLNPDFILVVDGGNDIVFPTKGGEGVPNHYFFAAETKLNSVFKGESTPWERLLPFLRYRRLSKEIEKIGEKPTPILTQEELYKATHFYVHSLNAIAERFHDKKVLFVTQPLRSFGEPGSWERKGYLQFKPLIEKIARTHLNVSYWDASDLFHQNSSAYLIDDGHMTDRGQANLAELLSKKLKKLVKYSGEDSVQITEIN